MINMINRRCESPAYSYSVYKVPQGHTPMCNIR